MNESLSVKELYLILTAQLPNLSYVHNDCICQGSPEKQSQ